MVVSEPMGAVVIHRCQSWEDFIGKVRSIEGIVLGNRFYRGQSNPAWPLSSVFERWLAHLKGGDPDRNVRQCFSDGKLEQFRDRYVDDFTALARGLFGLPQVMSPDDWWILGRHNGLVTPLLDWSESPYVAAFFAFIDYMERLNPGFKIGQFNNKGITLGNGTVAVWSLVHTDGLVKDGEFKILYPETPFSGHSQRVRAQKSVFTILTHDVHVDVESYLEGRGINSCLERFEIPGQEAGKALRDLELMNITFSDLFPDLGGAAVRANLGTTLWSLGGTGSKE